MRVLYEEYIKGAEVWYSNVQEELSSLYSEVSSLSDDDNNVYMDSSTYRKLLLSIATLYKEFSERYKLVVDMNIESNTLEDKLMAKIGYLESENKTLKVIGKQKMCTIVTDTGNKDLANLTNKIEEVIRLIEDNKKSIALSETMRSSSYKSKDRSGIKSPRYIKEIDNSELISLYEGANFTLTSEIVQYYKGKYNITYNGLMERLKTLGVWKYKNKK